MTSQNMWDYSSPDWSDSAIAGFRVEARDGHIGSIDEASNDVGAAYLVVDTGPWILGRKVVIPAGLVTDIDPQDEKVYVSCTKDQVKNSPELDEVNHQDPTYRDQLGGYYGGLG